MDSPLSKGSLKRVTEGSHWSESKQMFFPMILVLRAACISARSCFPGTDKNQRVLEKWHTKEENRSDPLKLNVPWQESVMPSNHLILCCPLLLLLSIFPSIRVFSNESAVHIRLPKYWSFSFNISPSNEYSRLISFRLDWFDLLAIQGTLKSLLQHHSWKVSVLLHSAFFIVQLSHSYMTTGKTITLI